MNKDWKDAYSSRSEAYDASDDVPTNRSSEPTMGDVINTRYGRRDVMRGALAVSAVTATFGSTLMASKPAQAAATFQFDEIAHGVDETHHVAPGYNADVLIRWGDPVLPGAPAFDPMNQSAAAEEQ